MTTNHDTDASEDDSLMAQANEQLERELFQSRKPTLAVYRASRRVVARSIFPSYIEDWMPAHAFRELYQNWYVPISFARQTLINAGRTLTYKDSILTVRASSDSWKNSTYIYRIFAPLHVVVVTSVVAFLYFVAIIYRMILMARQERS
jgi:hypothetical protein